MTRYDGIGSGYSHVRKADTQIAAAIHAALSDARSVINVGAGAGSYEPTDRTVLAVEPSDVMIRQRPSSAAVCLRGSANALPAEDRSFDAAMAILTVHHWPDLEAGLRELARVARQRVVLFTWVPDAAPFWLTDEYFPELLAHDRTIFPASALLCAALERSIGPARLTPVPVPHDCSDGFLGAYWRRPEMYLDERRRAAISSFSRIDAGPGVARLREDVDSGRWARRQDGLLGLTELDLGYRLATCDIL